MSRSQIEWDICRILISHLDDENLSDTIAIEIIQLIEKQNANKF